MVTAYLGTSARHIDATPRLYIRATEAAALINYSNLLLTFGAIRY